MSFLKNFKEAIGFQHLKVIEYELIALEDASHIMFAVDEFVNKGKAKKKLNSLTQYLWLKLIGICLFMLIIIIAAVGNVV